MTSGNLAREMADVKPRDSRRQRAAATRLRMARAAYDLFTSRGYVATTMADIAEAAGVAVQTLYFTFHTKAELLQRVYELAVLGPGEPVPPPASAWWKAAWDADRLEDALRELVQGSAEILARAAPLDEVVRAADHEPETAQVRAHNEQLRRDDFTRLIDRLGERFGLRDGLIAADATDLLLLLLGPRVYQGLVGEYGWPRERYLAWLARSIAVEIFAPQP